MKRLLQKEPVSSQHLSWASCDPIFKLLLSTLSEHHFLSYPNTFMALTKEYDRSHVLPHLLPSPTPFQRAGEILVFNQRLYFSSGTKEFNWDFSTA